MQIVGGREQTGEEKVTGQERPGGAEAVSGDQKGTVRQSTRDQEGLCANTSLEVSPGKVHWCHTEPTEGEEPAMGSQIRQGDFLIRGHVLCTLRSW